MTFSAAHASPPARVPAQTPVEDLAGAAWQSRCQKSEDELVYTTANEIQITNGKLVQSDVDFDAKNCAGPMIAAYRKIYSIQSARDEVRDNIEHKALFTLQFESERVYAGTPTIAALFNREHQCGFTDWKAGEERVCPDVPADTRTLFMRTTINQLAGQEVLEAAFAYDTRPTAVGTLFFRFTSDHDEMKPEAPMRLSVLKSAASFAPELEGEPWVYSCTENHSDILGAGNENAVQVEGQNFIQVENHFEDRECLGTARLTVKHVAQVSESGAQGEWKKFRAKLHEIRYRPGVKLVAEYFNEKKLCDRTNWQAGVEQSCPPAKDIYVAAIWQLDSGVVPDGQLLSLGLEKKSHTPPAEYPTAANFYGWRVNRQTDLR